VLRGMVCGNRRSARFRTAPSVLRHESLVEHKPEAGLSAAKKIDLIVCEVEPPEAQLGDRVDAIARKPDAQIFIGEQFVDDHSDANA